MALDSKTHGYSLFCSVCNADCIADIDLIVIELKHLIKKGQEERGNREGNSVGNVCQIKESFLIK